MPAFQPFIHWIPPGIPPQKALAGMAGMAAAWPHVPHTSVFVSRISCPVFLPPFALSDLFSPNEIQMARLNGDPFEESRKELSMLWRDDILVSLRIDFKMRKGQGLVWSWVAGFLIFCTLSYVNASCHENKQSNGGGGFEGLVTQAGRQTERKMKGEACRSCL